MRKHASIILLALLLSACVPAYADSAPPSTDHPSVWAAASPTGTLAPQYLATQNAIQQDYLTWQRTSDALHATDNQAGRDSAGALQTEQISSQRTLTSAEAQKLNAEAAYLQTLSALSVIQTAIPLHAQETQLEIELQSTQAAADLQSEIQRAALLAQQTSAAQSALITEMNISAMITTRTVQAVIATIAAPYTATIEAAQLNTVLEKQATGTRLLQVIAWGAVILAGIWLGLWCFVTIGARWNKESIEAEIRLRQASIMRAGDAAIQHNGESWEAMATAAPDSAVPVRPIPIHDWRRPENTPPAVLSETGLRCLEILKQSQKLYGGDSFRIATHRATTRSGDTWTSAIQALRAAGVNIDTNSNGDHGQGTYLMDNTLAELIYDLEIGAIKL